MGAVGYVLLAVAIVLIIVTMVLLIMLLRKKDNNQQTDNSLVVMAELNKIKNELSISFERSNVMINGQVANLSSNIKDLTERYDRFMMNMNGHLEQIRKDNNDALLKMREDNSKEMEKMREVVDQKLSENIEHVTWGFHLLPAVSNFSSSFFSNPPEPGTFPQPGTSNSLLPTGWDKAIQEHTLAAAFHATPSGLTAFS